MGARCHAVSVNPSDLSDQQVDLNELRSDRRCQLRSFSKLVGPNWSALGARFPVLTRLPPVEIVVKAKMATSKGGHFVN
jgi:hypothetical protein